MDDWLNLNGQSSNPHRTNSMTTTTLICLLVVAAIVIVWFLLADEIEQERKQRRYHVFHCHRCGIPIGALQRGICDDCFPKWMEEAKR